MALKDLSETAASNVSIDGVNTNEGTAMSNLNNGIRAVAAILRQATAGDSDTVASSPTCDIASPLSNFISISGQSQINGFSAGSPGLIKFLQFQSVLNLAHSASVLCPGSATIATAPNDIALVRYESSTITRLIAYQRAAAGPSTNTYTGMQRWAKGADVASLTSLILGTDGNYFNVTGVNSITGIATVGIGTWLRLHFNSSLALIHHATNFALPGQSIIVASAGDEADFVEYGSSVFRCTNYQRTLALNGVRRGTVLNKNPYATSTTTTQAHGLPGTPHFVEVRLICLSAEGGYAAGDIADYGAGNSGDSNATNAAFITVQKDATNVYLITGDSAPTVVNKTTAGILQITAANWRVEITPYFFG